MTTSNGALYLTGGTGFVGSALTQAWLARDTLNRAFIQTRSPERQATNGRITYVSSLSALDDDQDIAALVNLAGAPIADKRWTMARKAVLEASRIGLTRELRSQLEKRQSLPEVIISASAVGYYGTGGHYDETSGAGSGYAAQLCREWEEEARELTRFGRLAIARLGVVLECGGALDKLLPLFKLGLGGPIGDGKQFFSWIHMTDAVAALLAVIDNSTWEGAFNLTAPGCVTQGEFAHALGRVLNRPTLIPTPAMALRLVFGEMAQELLIEGQKVEPSRLLEKGFAFQYPQIEQALTNILKAC